MPGACVGVRGASAEGNRANSFKNERNKAIVLHQHEMETSNKGR